MTDEPDGRPTDDPDQPADDSLDQRADEVSGREIPDREMSDRVAETTPEAPDTDHPTERRGLWGTFWKWLHTPTPPPKPDATVEVAWLPLWQAQLVLHELWEKSVPAVVSEDHTSHLRFGAKEPMARIFVIGARAELARSIIEDVTGEPPIGLHG